MKCLFFHFRRFAVISYPYFSCPNSAQAILYIARVLAPSSLQVQINGRSKFSRFSDERFVIPSNTGVCLNFFCVQIDSEEDKLYSKVTLRNNTNINQQINRRTFYGSLIPNFNPFFLKCSSLKFPYFTIPCRPTCPLHRLTYKFYRYNPMPQPPLPIGNEKFASK